ncbi:hypothetical protein B0H16DRAFT_1693916 [Mycena metata]|uniref:Uncharacterized protein n=1 Tax=Mycena metata TaxID=1033252 RepID=A0AAD7IHL4_9AGAR|nr:hypothetical protein B0H16DRAFT_1693916 [Mycena metata]
MKDGERVRTTQQVDPMSRRAGDVRAAFKRRACVAGIVAGIGGSRGGGGGGPSSSFRWVEADEAGARRLADDIYGEEKMRAQTLQIDHSDNEEIGPRCIYSGGVSLCLNGWESGLSVYEVESFGLNGSRNSGCEDIQLTSRNRDWPYALPGRKSAASIAGSGNSALAQRRVAIGWIQKSQQLLECVAGGLLLVSAMLLFRRRFEIFDWESPEYESEKIFAWSQSVKKLAPPFAAGFPLDDRESFGLNNSRTGRQTAIINIRKYCVGVGTRLSGSNNHWIRAFAEY